MKQSLLLAALLFAPLAFWAQPVTGDPNDLPFSLEIEEVTQDEVPGLHSFAFAQHEGWWVCIGGRINGLHGFFVATGFPEDKANASVRLINPSTGETHAFGVDGLNLPWRDALKATNPQYAQDGATLYLCGGYGKSATTGGFVTFPVLTAVDLPLLVSKMLNNENPSGAFRQVEVFSLRVCGGEMDKMGDYFYLVGGHEFAGLYNQNGPPQFTQTYTNEIRRFKITNTPTALGITDFSAQHDDQNLHRRDFTLAPLLRPDGSPALGLYGGVFRPDADLPYYRPVYIAENQAFALENYEQIFSQYTCPAVPVFDSTDGAMYTIFFAGLSAHYYDQQANAIQYDEKVPFIRDITTLRRKADGTSREFLMPLQFDALLGTNMIFAPHESVPHYPNEVLRLRALAGRTSVGYLFGGIKAEIPNITPSSASNRMFEVFITPKTAVSITETTAAGDLRVLPNPFWAGEKVRVEVSGTFDNFLLVSANGSVIGRFGDDLPSLESYLSSLPAGVYFLKASGAAGSRVAKVLKGQ
jgi:hypothetical protein